MRRLRDVRSSRASECIDKAKQAVARIGHDRMSSALPLLTPPPPLPPFSSSPSPSPDSNLGHIETMSGRFQKARQTFNRVVNSPQAAALDLVGAYEGLARLHLTLNELDQCEAALERLDEEARRHQGLGIVPREMGRGYQSAIVAKARKPSRGSRSIAKCRPDRRRSSFPAFDHCAPFGDRGSPRDARRICRGCRAAHGRKHYWQFCLPRVPSSKLLQRAWCASRTQI